MFNLAKNDRRRFQRLKVNLSVWYQLDRRFHLLSMDNQQEYEGTTLDLSEAGIGLVTTHNIPAWAKLLIKFKLFKTDKKGTVNFYVPVEVMGQVKSSSFLETGLYRLGVGFEELALKDKLPIIEFINSFRSTP